MLKGISKLLLPELLKVLSEMEHGDEIVIADGIGGKEISDAVLSVIPVDIYTETNFMLMQTTQGIPRLPFGRSIEKSNKNRIKIFAKGSWSVLPFTNGQSRLTRLLPRVKARLKQILF